MDIRLKVCARLSSTNSNSGGRLQFVVLHLQSQFMVDHCATIGTRFSQFSLFLLYEGFLLLLTIQFLVLFQLFFSLTQRSDLGSESQVPFYPLQAPPYCVK